MCAGCCRLFTKGVNIFDVPNGDSLTVLLLDRPTSKLYFLTRACRTTVYMLHTPTWARTHIHLHSSSRVWQQRVKSCDARELCSQDMLRWGKKNECMKKQKAATVSMEQKKAVEEKCQQQIAASFCCRRQCGLGSLAFLPSHIMHHLFNQLSTTRAAE